MTTAPLNDPELDAPLAVGQPRIDVADLAERLLGAWKEQRLRSRENIKNPKLWRDDALGYAAHRERTLSQLHTLVEEGAVNLAFPKRLGGGDNHGGNIAAFEELVLADPSLQIKAGVQWGLFGAAVLHLGTQYHHDEFLPAIMSLEVPGAFAMTETGHGSDVASIGTTATYDEATEEWVIQTPFRGAWKDYLGNAALHGRAAVVFAQLITKGVNHGVHAFYVPIRTDEGEFLPGVGGEDDGVKGGLNGIDNGRLHFEGVRVPRRNLLNRYGDVAEDGTYSSPIESPGRRFFTMLGTLVQGRVSLDGAANAAAKASLQIGVTYANERRQFAGGSGEEVVLLDYALHQRRILPRIATTYAVAFAHENLLRQFHGVFSGELDTPENREDLETLAAALKPLSTWHGLETVQAVREACGGQGYLAENRVAMFHNDLDIYTTFEGDNHVLLQLVGKRLLADYGAQLKQLDKKDVTRQIVGQTAERVFSGVGLRRIGQAVIDLGQTGRSVGWLRNPQNQHDLLTGRVQAMVADLAMALRNAGKLPEASAAALFNANQVQLIEAARAHGELLQWEAFTDGLAQFADGSATRRVLTWLRDLFGLGLIEKHLSWYLISGRLSPQRAAAVSAYIDRLSSRLRPHAQDLVDAFGYGPEHLRARIATGEERERQDEAHAYYAAQRASGEAPVDEKALHKQKEKAARAAAKAAKEAGAKAGKATMRVV